MKPSTLDESRIRPLNDRKARKGDYVLYWMQQSQRAEYNHALEYAIQRANRLGQPLLAAFGLTAGYPEANLRHYTFMLEGLRETQRTLEDIGIKLAVQLGDPSTVAASLGRNASLIVCDRGYLGHQKKWRRAVAHSAACPVVQVESDVIVPVEVVSTKAEYAARTIRPKIHKHLPDYLVPFDSGSVDNPSTDLKIESLDLKNISGVLKRLSIDKRIAPVPSFFKGGTSQAKTEFDAFIKRRLRNYVKNRNQPQTDDSSRMSPYLHFGQISPLYLALKIKNAKHGQKEAQEAFLEELIVRRELAVNFVNFTPDYDKLTCLPRWAQQTLEAHRKDRREVVYTRRRLEAAQTHDDYWNAAMHEMKLTGYMHNYMRMYWGKKIVEWSNTPAHAFRTVLALNNTYFLDGRDPNSYAGAAWIFGLHDRAWPERPVFGKIRYMNAAGLERKCDIQGYVEKVQSLQKSV